MNKIVIKNIRKSFKRTAALQSVDLEIENGLFGLLGENGAGKTTLMRIMSTILIPDAGDISFGNLCWSKNPDEVRKMIGYLPQDFGIFKNITAYECLEYIAGLKGLKDKKIVKEQICRILEDVNLYDYKDKKVGGYSGGMKRRLGIAQALINNPYIIIVDEPTAGLDPKERIHFRNLLRNLGKDHIVLLSTHIVEDIEAVCERAAVIKNGKSRQFSTLSELAGMAENKVWIWQLSRGDYEALNESIQIISTKNYKDIVELRVISDEKPNNDAVKTEPTVEEGYLIWNMNQE